MALALFCSNTPIYRNVFTYVDQQGIVHEPGFYTIIIGEILLLFSGIWFVRVYLAKRKELKTAVLKLGQLFLIKGF